MSIYEKINFNSINIFSLFGQLIPAKQSIREAIEHLLARNREILPLFGILARPMNVELKRIPYLGVLDLVFNALQSTIIY